MYPVSGPASTDQWTLVRNARQLLTLRGHGGPRRGAAMAELGIIPNGAVLIRNGHVYETGPTRRVENLRGARHAQEIDATGRMVMPAFVDADVALVRPVPADDGRSSLRLMSQRRVLEEAALYAEECARYGCVTVGAHTRWSNDFRTISRTLRVHRALQSRPLRIRSIFSVQRAPDLAGQIPDTLSSRWLLSVMNKRLASIAEFTVSGLEGGFDESRLRSAARAAASLGYAIRLRSARPLEADGLQVAIDSGAIAVLAPLDPHRPFACRLNETGVVRVIPASEGFNGYAAESARALRCVIEAGAGVAITAGCDENEVSSQNMQHILHVAVYGLGLTVEEAITATTWNAAYSLRMTEVIGSLERDKPADLLMMEVPDYRELPRRAGHWDASLVMREGRVIYRKQPAEREEVSH